MQAWEERYYDREEAMQLTVLGTGNATVTECYNTCFVLSEGERHFLVDGGGGNQILKILKDVHIRLDDIHDIFVTHEHLDHLIGVIWLIRMIGQKINKGAYSGNLRIYCFKELADKIQTIANMTIQQKVCRYFGSRIKFVIVEDRETREIIGHKVTFFDIHSTKAKQFGFSMELRRGAMFTCAGDEPCSEENYDLVQDSEWLLHEAFCLYAEADEFKPYEKHHSTVREACQLAEKLWVKNLLLYHTEEKNLKKRKELYVEEGKEYYHGNLYVPYDLECFEI